MTRPRSAKLIAAKAKARRQGWSKWIRSEADERAILDGYYVDQRRADHVVEFGPRYLRHQRGDFAGRPFELLPWQEDQLFRPLFGWVHDSNEYGRQVRRYRRAYVQVPKKNGKSPTGAYVALYMLVADGEPGAECYSAATDRAQAGIVWNTAATMADASPKLARVLKLNRTACNIAYRATNSFYRVLSGCPRRNEGWEAHCIIADELHKWYGRELYDALKWAFASRAEPMLFQITTAGDDTTSVCYEQRDYACDVAAGRVYDPQFFPLVFEPDPDDDPDDEATWRKVNPSLGSGRQYPLKLSAFRSDHREAKQNRGLYEAWKQLRLNLWRSSSTPWLDRLQWDAGSALRKKKRRRIDCYENYRDDDLAGFECWGGLDLALTTDLSAFVMVFPDDLEAEPDNVTFRTIARFWVPEETAHRFRDRVPYLQFAEEGWVTLTPGNEVDFDAILSQIAADAERYQLNEVGYDPMFASYLTQRLESEHGVPRVEFQQTLQNYAEPCQMFERLVLRHRMRHSGNELLSFCVASTSIYTDDRGRVRPVRPKRRDHRRIDGTVATIMGLALALRGDSSRPTYYDDHEPEFL